MQFLWELVDIQLVDSNFFLFSIEMFLRRLQSNDDEGIDGSEVSLFWMLPFLSLLLCIAFIPLFFPRFWHKWFWTIPAVHLTVFLISFFSAFGFEKALIEVLHTFLEEYIPFIGLMFSLFVVSGGIRVKNIELTGQPWQNTCILVRMNNFPNSIFLAIGSCLG